MFSRSHEYIFEAQRVHCCHHGLRNVVHPDFRATVCNHNMSALQIFLQYAPHAILFLDDTEGNDVIKREMLPNRGERHRALSIVNVAYQQISILCCMHRTVDNF